MPLDLLGFVKRVTMGQKGSEVEMPKRLVSVTEAAKETGLSLAYIRRLVAEGRIRGEKIGSFWVIDWNDLKRFLASPRDKGRPPIDK